MLNVRVAGDLYVVFFFNDTATTEIYTLSLHDALPIWARAPGPHDGRVPRSPRRSRGHGAPGPRGARGREDPARGGPSPRPRDRKSTRLNSSHGYISYAVFCLKKKKT